MKKYLFLILFTLVLSFSLCTCVEAKSARVKGVSLGYYYHAKYEYGYYSKYGQLLDYRISDGEYADKKAYCFAPTEELYPTVDYDMNLYDDDNLLKNVNDTQNVGDNKVTSEQLKKMALIAFYGYGYNESHKTTAYILASQMLIYRVMENQVFTDTLCSNPECSKIDDPYEVKEAMTEINDLISKHDVKPKFDKSKFSVNINKQIELKDSNQVLENYKISSMTNCEAKIEGDKLIITGKKLGEAKVKLVKGDVYQNKLMFLTSSESQNMVVPGNIDLIEVEIVGEVKGGKVEVLKKDEAGKKLKGAKFKVYKEEKEVCSITTNDDGVGKCENLDNGTYTLKEVEAPLGYVKSDKVYTFKITDNNYEIKMDLVNEKIKGSVEIYKESADFLGDASLKGAKYGIYNLDNVLVGEIITDLNGYGKFDNLEYGEYYIKEIEAPLGFKLDLTKHEFQIKNNKEVIKITSNEEVEKYNFKLTKTMSNGGSGVVLPEDNAIFDIYLDRNGEYVTSITTDSEGKAIIELPYGVYNVCQKKGNGKTNLAPCFKIEVYQDLERVVNNELLKARLRIVKVDSETNEILPIAGIKFKIKNLDTEEYVCQIVSYPSVKKICTFVTDDKGFLVLPDYLEAGRYKIEEVNQEIKGYLWNNEGVEFAIDDKAELIFDEDLGNILEVKFPNKRVKGKIIVKKVGEVFLDDTIVSLKGIKFGLYDENNKLLGIYVTNQDGIIVIDNLELGKYFLKELETKDGYVLDNDVYEIDLNYINQYIPVVEENIEIKNYLIKGNFEILKTDEAGNPLEGVEFGVYNLDEELVQVYVTDKNGKIKGELPYGKYYLKEIKALDGYFNDEDKRILDIGEETVFLKLENKRRIRISVPSTGSKKQSLEILFLVNALGFLVYKKLPIKKAI